MAEGNNKLKLMNTKKRLMRVELPELRLGERIDKLTRCMPKQTLDKLEEFFEDLRKEGSDEQNIKD